MAGQGTFGGGHAGADRGRVPAAAGLSGPGTPFTFRRERFQQMMSDLWQDCRYGARVLLRARGHAVLAIGTIAVAIGANTTIFTVVNGTLLAALPFPEAD